uniref:Phosphate-regulating neutral endopeptidase (inferred by orthology to a human protein) n=1 Tax=Strongyloides venezuelensis TaxID=75913 RepID=A0A0K0FP28_STRVS
MLKSSRNSDFKQSFIKFNMNVLILILYTYILFCLSQGCIPDLLKNILKNKKKFSPEKLYSETASRSLYEYVDINVEPCDNFYKFSCNNWIKSKEKLRGSNESFNYNSRMSNFEHFIKEFEEGKYNNVSRTIFTLYKLRERCNELSEDKFKDCQLIINTFKTYALSAIFIKKNEINSEMNGDYSIIEDMIERIKEEFRLLIDEKKDIFDEETRQHFLHKLNEIEFKRNSDEDDLFNVTLMENCYDNIGINYNDPIENIVETIKRYKELSENDEDNLKSCRGKIFQSNKYLVDYVFSNALYNNNDNFFSISSDYFNEPSFSRSFPMSLNYGGIGYTIAHEILHAFDSGNYRNMGKGGNKNKFNVTKKSIKIFNEKGDCFIRQYDKQKESIINKNINGLITLDENIADNGGIKIAHRAYMKYLQSIYGKDLVVPGFENFSNEQLFFISVGKKNCEYKSKDILEKQVKNSEYPPGEIRINVVLSNYKPFSNAFKCKLNSKMNPEIYKFDSDYPNGPIVIEFQSEPLNTTLGATNFYDFDDPEVKLCDDFNLFSCGKWIKTQKKIYEHKFYKGKFNDRSRIINNIQNLLMKCYEQSESFIADCQSKILNFGNYGTSSLFLNENKINSKINGDYNIIEDMIERIKEEFRLLIDEKKDIFDE